MSTDVAYSHHDDDDDDRIASLTRERNLSDQCARAAISELMSAVLRADRLMAERDEARREICDYLASNACGIGIPAAIALVRGWDCCDGYGWEAKSGKDTHRG